MKVYITMYALTEGVLEVDAEVFGVNGDAVSYRRVGAYFQDSAHGRGKDWHETLGSAVDKFEAMRSRKIASLKKKIAELEKMTFKLKELDTK